MVPPWQKLVNLSQCRQYSNDHAVLEDNLVSFPHQLLLGVQIGRFTFNSMLIEYSMNDETIPT